LAGGECVPPVEPVLRTNAKGVKARPGGANISPHAAVDNSQSCGEASGTVGCKKERDGVKPSSPKPSGTVKEPVTPQPPVGTGGSSKTERPKTESGERRERRRWRWTEQRSTIEDRGRDLGLGGWDEAAWRVGGESFQGYTARVYVAHLASLGVAITLPELREAKQANPAATDAELLRLVAARAKDNDESQRSSPHEH
jgi:hypothetical protein